MPPAKQSLEDALVELGEDVRSYDSCMRATEHHKVWAEDTGDHSATINRTLKELRWSQLIIDGTINQAIFGGVAQAQQYNATLFLIVDDLRFRDWFRGYGSSAFTIWSKNEQLWTPLSYMLALMAKKMPVMLYDVNPIICVCRSFDRGHSWFREMTRSIISQLIMQNVDNNSLVPSFHQGLWDIIRANNRHTRGLCNVFEGLVPKLRAGTIVCIVDSVDFVVRNYQGCAQEIMAMLNRLVLRVEEMRRAGQTTLSFKVLVTSYGSSVDPASFFPDQHHLEIVERPEQLPIESKFALHYY
ncbi:adenosine trna methylthiotransferase [Diplodia corticola]|uniref:Adenosine trna methylthiotransferase n=1 Tax=Diplodia corticola TaxID=236234 RepID=A0A1J9QP96_9PEZI|nr:adenosine trna methylthiotransferase [Diplodia corticola]OJD30273.1 adenosine trna methylthiotransferase [Diplodia corticola]